eukprot:7380092-Prymnesium_polylepis.2
MEMERVRAAVAKGGREARVRDKGGAPLRAPALSLPIPACGCCSAALCGGVRAAHRWWVSFQSTHHPSPSPVTRHRHRHPSPVTRHRHRHRHPSPVTRHRHRHRHHHRHRHSHTLNSHRHPDPPLTPAPSHQVVGELIVKVEKRHAAGEAMRRRAEDATQRTRAPGEGAARAVDLRGKEERRAAADEAKRKRAEAREEGKRARPRLLGPADGTVALAEIAEVAIAEVPSMGMAEVPPVAIASTAAVTAVTAAPAVAVAVEGIVDGASELPMATEHTDVEVAWRQRHTDVEVTWRPVSYTHLRAHETLMNL